MRRDHAVNKADVTARDRFFSGTNGDSGAREGGGVGEDDGGKPCRIDGRAVDAVPINLPQERHCDLGGGGVWTGCVSPCESKIMWWGNLWRLASVVLIGLRGY